MTPRKTKPEPGLNIPRAFAVMLPRIARVSPGFFVIWQLLSIAHGLAYGLIAPVTQRFFDLAAGFAAHNAELSAAITGLLLLGGMHVVKQALNGIANFMTMAYYRKAEGVLALGLHEKMGNIAPICFEDANMLDDMNKAVQGKNEAVWFTGTMLSIVSFYLPYFACMAAYLLRIKPLLAASLALVFTPTLITQVLRTKVFSKAEDASAPVRRAFDYYESCMVDRTHFKETRILGAFSFFRALYADTLAVLNRLRFRAAVKADLAELGMQSLSLCGYAGILLLLVNALLSGDIGVGAFAAIFGSVDQMFSLMKEIICHNLGAVARDFGRVRNYLRFMDLPERTGADSVPDDADIALRGVFFSYPGAARCAVSDVTLTIHNGETVAIVGENGSGKSTLARLITGLYLPQGGDVRYGAVSTGKLDPGALYRRISAVFQRVQKYQMCLMENIGIGDAEKAADAAELDAACERAGVDVHGGSFREGYETMLSREFGGVDLSGGEWQRVAIARGFFRDHRLIVLDEPTAAIDPIEETRVYNRFAEISRGKTALIITHRLGSVRLADRILVMKDGQLVEQGSHGELLAAGGEYARLYRAQRKWYVA